MPPLVRKSRESPGFHEYREEFAVPMEYPSLRMVAIDERFGTRILMFVDKRSHVEFATARIDDGHIGCRTGGMWGRRGEIVHCRRPDIVGVVIGALSDFVFGFGKEDSGNPSAVRVGNVFDHERLHFDGAVGIVDFQFESGMVFVQEQCDFPERVKYSFTNGERRNVPVRRTEGDVRMRVRENERPVIRNRDERFAAFFDTDFVAGFRRFEIVGFVHRREGYSGYKERVVTSPVAWATNSATDITVCSPVFRERTETVFPSTSFSPMTRA